MGLGDRLSQEFPIAGGLLHAGDAYVHHSELQYDSVYPGIVKYQGMLDVDKKARIQNQARLRELANNPEAKVHVFCSHDPLELAQLSNV